MQSIRGLSSFRARLNLVPALGHLQTIRWVDSSIGEGRAAPFWKVDTGSKSWCYLLCHEHASDQAIEDSLATMPRSHRYTPHNWGNLVMKRSTLDDQLLICLVPGGGFGEFLIFRASEPVAA